MPGFTAGFAPRMGPIAQSENGIAPQNVEAGDGTFYTWADETPVEWSRPS